MYDYVIYIICVFVFFKTLAYSVWSFKNSGALSGAAAFIISVMCLAPLVLLRSG